MVSYKEEHSDDDADLMTDNEEDEASKDVPEEEEHLDTIEKIIDSREGKKGGSYFSDVLLLNFFIPKAKIVSKRINFACFHKK